MTGTVAIEGGCLPSSARRSWVPRTVAALFLGAGVYAAISVAGQAANADETAAVTTQTDAAATTEAQPTTADPAPATASEPAAGTASITTTSSPGETSSSTTTVSTTTTTTASSGSAAASTAAAPDTAAATEPAQTVMTTSTTSTAAGATTVTTTTVTTNSGDEVVTVTTAPVAPTNPAATTAPQKPATAPATATGPVAAVITQATSNLCDPAGVMSPAAGSDRSHAAVTATSSATSNSVAATAATTPDLSVPGLSAPADAPLAPQQPYQEPAPASAIGLGGCGGPGADQNSPKGTSAPAAVGVLGSPFEISLAGDGAALAAPAAGSPTLTATDPATRPD